MSMELASPDVLSRARKIKPFLTDVDGTLTDGGVCPISSTTTEEPDPVVREMKVFDAHDGQGLSSHMRLGRKRRIPKTLRNNASQL